MLNTVEYSRADKTKGCAVTYRAGAGAMYATCPDSCQLKPRTTDTRSIDRVYERAVRAAVPMQGTAWTYTHFSPGKWALENSPGLTTFNYSAPSLNVAVTYARRGIAAVAVVPAGYWEVLASPRSIKIDSVRVVRCPAEYDKRINCRNCGKGRPLCARMDRNYVVAFTAHGRDRRLASSDDRGGCYAGSGNVAIHWRRLSDSPARLSDSESLAVFVSALPPKSFLRHHVAGDLGVDNG